MSGERALIERYFLRRHARDDVILGIGDDGAVTRLRRGCELVSATDTVVEGVHFPRGLAPAAVGHRVLAVNLSDLAAMGADPAWALLALACEDGGADWLQQFADGFFALAERFGVGLVGGDLVRAPLAATVTALGQVPRGRALQRAGARAGDIVYVTGTLGGAAAGLSSLLDGTGVTACERRFLFPEPRVAAGVALRGIASAAIDLSDGLVTDAARVALASGVRLEIDAARVAAVAAGDDVIRALRGGDDYELLFTVSAAREQMLREAELGCRATAIGRVVDGAGVGVAGHDVEALQGYDHFDPCNDPR